MRTYLLAAAAIAALTAGSIAFLYAMDAQDGPRPPAPPPAPVTAAPQPQGPDASGLPPLPARERVRELLRSPDASREVVEPPPLIVEAAPPPPPPGSWEAAPSVGKVSSLGAEGGALRRELNTLTPRVAACFDEASQSRYGSRAITSTGDATLAEEDGTPILVLYVETRRGQMTIVDAPVQTRGNASDGLIACAQQVLRGHQFSAREARTEGRRRIVYPLLP